MRYLVRLGDALVVAVEAPLEGRRCEVHGHPDPHEDGVEEHAEGDLALALRGHRR